MDKVRLNNFILWCKNWYEPINKTDIITQARKILTLDDYMPYNNPITISLTFIDELVEEGIISPINLFTWYVEINKYQFIYGYDYQSSLMYRIKDFLAYECGKLPLAPPIYSRKVYKLGFVGPSFMGNSYKMLNYKAKNIFNKIDYGKNKENIYRRN